GRRRGGVDRHHLGLASFEQLALMQRAAFVPELQDDGTDDEEQTEEDAADRRLDPAEPALVGHPLDHEDAASSLAAPGMRTEAASTRHSSPCGAMPDLDSSAMCLICSSLSVLRTSRPETSASPCASLGTENAWSRIITRAATPSSSSIIQQPCFWHTSTMRPASTTSPSVADWTAALSRCDSNFAGNSAPKSAASEDAAQPMHTNPTDQKTLRI